MTKPFLRDARVSPYMKIYTKKGDDGTTGLLYGGRVSKNALIIEANGAIDEAQSAIGLARAYLPTGSELVEIVISLERDLWIVMGEVATNPANRDKLVATSSVVTNDMVLRLEGLVDLAATKYEMPNEFVIPGSNLVSAHLDFARTIVRRAERLVVGLDLADNAIVSYLNRLSDLLWALARWQESDHLLAKHASSSPKN